MHDARLPLRFHAFSDLPDTDRLNDVSSHGASWCHRCRVTRGLTPHWPALDSLSSASMACKLPGTGSSEGLHVSQPSPSAGKSSGCVAAAPTFQQSLFVGMQDLSSHCVVCLEDYRYLEPQGGSGLSMFSLLPVYVLCSFFSLLMVSSPLSQHDVDWGCSDRTCGF